MANKQNRVVAQQTFRQFAWHLAGTLQSAKTGSGATARPVGKR